MQKTHGEVKQIDGKRVPSPEYRAWQAMRNRCYNTRAKDYAYYGAKGIRVCRRWNKFENFLADMGRRPSALHTLDRIRTAGNYTPGNCRWATRETQARNRPYAKTKAWLFAEQRGISINTARHMIWQVRAKDRGAGTRFDLSPEPEAATRAFLESLK